MRWKLSSLLLRLRNFISFSKSTKFPFRTSSDATRLPSRGTRNYLCTIWPFPFLVCLPRVGSLFLTPSFTSSLYLSFSFTLSHFRSFAFSLFLTPPPISLSFFLSFSMSLILSLSLSLTLFSHSLSLSLPLYLYLSNFFSLTPFLSSLFSLPLSPLSTLFPSLLLYVILSPY